VTANPNHITDHKHNDGHKDSNEFKDDKTYLHNLHLKMVMIMHSHCCLTLLT